MKKTETNITEMSFFFIHYSLPLNQQRLINELIMAFKKKFFWKFKNGDIPVPIYLDD